ncbi:thioesterase domain-containing protein [Ascidiimonas sp. W6]|uniref:thioesterase domain-containing protein n=1 Tax=Ascidiimonas meishanensis TaxID=3128903 RepID=UPI0030EED4C3
MNELLNKLRKNKIKVTLEGDNIKVKLPKDFQNSALLAEIKEHKEELIKCIKLMKERSASSTLGTERMLLLKEPYKHRNNLFFLHDGSGNVNSYIALADMINSANCYGIMYKANHFAPETVSVEELATYYIKEMKSVQNTQPYNLIGWSFGGILCYEMARQLQKNGEKVNCIVMIDTGYFPNKSSLNFNLKQEKEILKLIFKENSKWISDSNSTISLWDTAIQSGKIDDISFETVLKFTPEDIKPMLSGISDKEEILKTHNIIRTLINSLFNYKLRGYINTNVLYIKAKDNVYATSDFLNNHINSLTIKESKGDHFSIMDKSNAKFLSQTIEDFFLSMEEKDTYHFSKILNR